MADHPLRPATDRRLGRPLPHQLANQPWAHLKAQRAFPFPDYAVLAAISGCYPPLRGRFPCITHPFAARLLRLARLACVKPTANVRSEPGSNSQLDVATLKAAPSVKSDWPTFVHYSVLENYV